MNQYTLYYAPLDLLDDIREIKSKSFSSMHQLLNPLRSIFA